MRLLVVLTTFLVQLIICARKGQYAPIVASPPVLCWNASNKIFITTNEDAAKGKEVEIGIEITAVESPENRGEVKSIIVKETTRKVAGQTQLFTFNVPVLSEHWAHIAVKVSHHDEVHMMVLMGPNVKTIHMRTDKGFYKAGETVTLRATPITSEGRIYSGEIDFTLVNPDDFELTKHRVAASNGEPLEVKFTLPEHLFFGQWQIKAVPLNSPNGDQFVHTVTFHVADYTPPPFILDMEVKEDEATGKPMISVNAKYFHGEPVSGSAKILCVPPKKNASEILVAQKEVSSGSQQIAVNLERCFIDGQNGSTEIICEVTDTGTGRKAVTKTVYDPSAPGFQLIPLRPAFTDSMKELLFAVVPDSLGDQRPGPGHVEIYCISGKMKDREYVDSVLVSMNSVVRRSLPADVKRCKVLHIKWFRKLSATRNTRERVMLLPNIDDVHKLDFSLIEETDGLQGSFTVGNHFAVALNKKHRRVNYLVTCNSKDLVKSSHTTNSRISFPITRKMIGNCVLYAFTPSFAHIDVLLFFVKDKCDGRTSVSLKALSPGDKVTFTMTNGKYGYALLDAIDEKIARLMQNNAGQLERSWESVFFVRTYRKEEKLRIKNLISVAHIIEKVADKCSSAGLSYSLMFNSCPEAKASPSAVSDFCMQKMVLSCNSTSAPKTSPSCERGASNCVVEAIRQPTKSEVITNAGFTKLGLMKVGVFARTMLKTVVKPSPAIQEDAVLEAPILPSDDYVHTRTFFPNVWFFNHFSLGSLGKAVFTTHAPDTIGSWQVKSEYWTPGDHSYCRTEDLYIVSKKSYFMELDIPKNTYVNESFTVKVSVTGQAVNETINLSACFDDIPRQMCADLGPSGDHGLPTYSRIVLTKENPVTTKTFNIRFFKTGEAKFRLKLRRETFDPANDYCQVGDVLDSVETTVMVSKRADTEEHYRRLILSTDKPVSRMLHDAESSLTNGEGGPEMIDIDEYRSYEDNGLVSIVRTNLMDTDVVYSFTIELAKFLPNNLPSDENDYQSDASNRVKRGISAYDNSFLSDVIKKLSVQLYRFKHLRKLGTPIDSGTEKLENSIGQLIANMLPFSDCSTTFPCGFGEYYRPQTPEDRSIVMTTLATSLLCEAIADEKLVCGSIAYIRDTLKNNLDNPDLLKDFKDYVDINNPEDRKWFLRALLHHVSDNCLTYQCLKDDDAWGRLYRDFHFLDESLPFDNRVVAALSYMATNSTNHLMRLKMYSQIRENMIPFWSAGQATKSIEDRLRQGNEDILSLRRMKSGDVLVNSLGILAFIERNVDASKKLDFDSLIDWVYEQKKDDGTYDTALDTYFASRAIYEYRVKRVVVGWPNKDLKVKIVAPRFEERILNVTDTPIMLYLPTTTRNLTITTTGFGKVKVGVRILASKRRSRRDLFKMDPVRIRISQMKTFEDIVIQTICLTSLSPIISALEVTHGIFTGYTTYKDKISVLENSTEHGFEIFGQPTISSFAVHMLVQGLQSQKALCYTVAQIPPKYVHEPDELAPVSISVRHPSAGEVGDILIAHPDALISRRLKRSVPSNIPVRNSLAAIASSSFRTKKRKTRHHKISVRRTIRSFIDESIETVCFRGGSCTCGELTCNVRCTKCSGVSEQSVREEMCERESLAVFGTLIRESNTMFGNGGTTAEYNVYTLRVIRSISASPIRIQDAEIDIYLRSCNKRCISYTKLKTTSNDFIMVGDVRDLVIDNQARYHYVLRMDDRFEKVDSSCVPYSGIFFANSFDFSKC